MNKDILGFGIIGCGGIASTHADIINRIDCATLIGITDVNEKARNSFSERYSTTAFNTTKELLENKDIDIVCICTPSGLHAELAIEAANFGKHIIVEKPMATNLKDADSMIKACEENNVKLTVIFQLRFSPQIKKLKKALEKNELGRLITGDVYMKYYRSQEYYDAGGWRGTWSMDGGGALMNQGIHNVDLLYYTMGAVKSVFAHTKTMARNIETEDTAVALLEYKSGALGVIQATTSIYPGFQRRVEINGDKGSVVMEEDTIVSWSTESSEAPNVQESTEKTGMGGTGYKDPFSISSSGHELQFIDFINAVKNDRKPIIDHYEGRKSLEIIMAIYESSRTGKLILLEDK